MCERLHSVFSPLRVTTPRELSCERNTSQGHRLTFLFDSDEDSLNNKHQERTCKPGIASVDLVAEIKTACSAAAQHHEPAGKRRETPSSRVAQIYGNPSTELSLHLRTGSSDGEIVTQTLYWNPSDSGSRSAEDGIPRPDSPTI